MPIKATAAEFDPVELFNRPALFTNERVDRETVPEGLFAYDIRHGDDDGRAVTVEKTVSINHMGTLITAQALTFGQNGYIPLTEENGGLNFSADHDCVTVGQFQTYLRCEAAHRLPDNGILTADACIEGSRQDHYAGKIVVLKPDVLKPQYRFASDQLIYARLGSGCSPTARGRLVIGDNLYDGTTERYGREGGFHGDSRSAKTPRVGAPGSPENHQIR